MFAGKVWRCVARALSCFDVGTHSTWVNCQMCSLFSVYLAASSGHTLRQRTVFEMSRESEWSRRGGEAWDEVDVECLGWLCAG